MVRFSGIQRRYKCIINVASMSSSFQLRINQWDNRAAAFFASFAFAVGTIGTNIASNSLSAANDMTVLFPRYINIRRGQILCCILGGWALVPWEILASAPGFLNFMSGYTVFLSPFASM